MLINFYLTIYIKDHSKFVFSNQAEYDKVGDYVIQYVDYSIHKSGLEKIWVPNSNAKNPYDFYRPAFEPQCHIYVNKNLMDHPIKNLLLLIQGTGAVRAG